MAVTAKDDRDEEQIGLLDVNPPVYEDACSQPHDGPSSPVLPRSHNDSSRVVNNKTIAQITGLSALWLLAISSVGIFRHLFLWQPAVYGIAAVVGVGVVAGISWTCAVLGTVVCGIVLGNRLKRDWIGGLAFGAAFISLISVATFLVVGLEECASDELRVFVRVVPGVSSLVTATVMLSSSFDEHQRSHVLALQRFNGIDNDASIALGWVHGADDYTLTYNLSAGTAYATDGSSATFARDDNMEIAFADKTRPITLDATFRDISIYGGGERILRRMATARGCSALKFCAAKFAPTNATDIRARARVLYPLGLQMRDFVAGPRC